jgi:hypothetical protein
MKVGKLIANVEIRMEDIATRLTLEGIEALIESEFPCSYDCAKTLGPAAPWTHWPGCEAIYRDQARRVVNGVLDLITGRLRVVGAEMRDWLGGGGFKVSTPGEGES